MKSTKLFLGIFLFLACLSVKAQDKYEFMIIAYYLESRNLVINIDGKEFIREEIKQEKNDPSAKGSNPLIKKVNEFQDQSWEVMSFNTTSYLQRSGYSSEGMYCYLRRKKKS